VCVCKSVRASPVSLPPVSPYSLLIPPENGENPQKKTGISSYFLDIQRQGLNLRLVGEAEAMWVRILNIQQLHLWRLARSQSRYSVCSSQFPPTQPKMTMLQSLGFYRPGCQN
jgi:hypothetical protein